MHNRAQGLPITTIILAILGVTILVVLFAMVIGRIGIFGRGVNECPGVCVIQKNSPPPDAPASVRNSPCDKNFERELSGNFVASGLKPDQKATEFICEQCCVPLLR